MNNSTAVASAAQSGLAQFLLRRRVVLSVIVFVSLVAEDLLEGVRPHGILDMHDWYATLGLMLIVLGLTLRSWAAGTLHKWKELTATGPYRLIRHPLYVGSFLMMIGFCLLIDDSENIWVVLGPLCALYVLTVRNEERKLAKKFGDVWTEYARRTPRLLPRLLPRFLPTLAAGEWRLGQWFKNREYQAVAGTLAGLVAIEFWHLSPLHF